MGVRPWGVLICALFVYYWEVARARYSPEVDDVMLLVHLLHRDDLAVPVRVAIRWLDSCFRTTVV